MSDDTKLLVFSAAGAAISTSLGLGPNVGWCAGHLAIGLAPAADDAVIEDVPDASGESAEAQ